MDGSHLEDVSFPAIAETVDFASYRQNKLIC